MAVRTAEREAHGAAVRLPVDRIAAYLQSTLGQKLTALIAGVSNPKAVGQWGRGVRKPYPDAEQRLRDAYQVVELLLRYEGPGTARAWFVGMNPELDGEPPASAIAECPIEVMQAARVFLADAY